MTKVLLCAGNHTQAILQQIGNTDNGIEVFGSLDTKKLEKDLRSIGSVQKIVILESGIVDGYVPELIDTLNFDVVFLLNDEQLLENLDIRFVGKSNIYILDNQHKKISFLFIKDVIKDLSKVIHLRYKTKDILFANNEDENKEESQEDNAPFITRDESAQNEEQEDNQPVILNNPVVSFDVPEEPIIQREVALEKDESNIKVSAGGEVDNKEQIRRYINYYKEGCIFLFSGTPKSYTSTTIWTIANYLASIDLTVGIIDLDTIGCSFNLLTKKVYSETSMYINEYNLENAIKRQNMLNTSILIKNNIHLLTSNILGNSYNINQNELEPFIDNNKRNYNIILIDTKLYDIQKLYFLYKKANKIIFNIPLTNKDLFEIMRYFELNEPIREDLFTKSCYISIDNTKKCLLDTKQKNLCAIDDYLNKNSIVNELKYSNIHCVGNILTKQPKLDFLEPQTKVNKLEIENIILNILRG